MAHYDLIVRGGMVVDGSGLPRRRVDVGVRDGKVATLAKLDDATAEEEIDATGMIVAPVKPEDRDFLQGIFAAVENMDPVALSAITWDECETFEQFVDTRRDRLGINFATYVGHSNLRRWVMGEGATQREATDAEVAEMRRMVREAMAAGAAGISSSAAPTHRESTACRCRRGSPPAKSCSSWPRRSAARAAARSGTCPSRRSAGSTPTTRRT